MYVWIYSSGDFSFVFWLKVRLSSNKPLTRYAKVVIAENFCCSSSNTRYQKVYNLWHNQTKSTTKKTLDIRNAFKGEC